MISMAYINGTTSDDMYRSTDLLKEMNYMESCMDSFNKEWSIFESIQDNAIFEASLYGTDINENAVYTEAVSDILKKIGDAVISLCKKFVDFVNKIITNIKSLGFNKKSDIAKIESLIKLHPEMKNEVILHADDLNLNDMKSLKELDKAFDELMAMSKKKDIKPGSMRDHWEKAMKKFENIDKQRAAKIAIGTAAVTTAVITLVTVVPKIKSAYSGAEKSANEAMDSRKKKSDALVRNIDALKKAGVNPEEMGKLEICVKANQVLNGEYSKALEKNQSKLQKTESKVIKCIDKLTGKSGYGKDAVKSVDLIKGLRDDEDNRKIAQEVSKATQVKTAQLNAELNHRRANADAYNNLELGKLRATRRERLNFENDKADYSDYLRKSATSVSDKLNDMENTYQAKQLFNKNHPKTKRKFKLKPKSN